MDVAQTPTGGTLPKLSYREEDRFAPIPPADAGLQTIEAEPFASIELPDDVPVGLNVLEGLAFGHDGALYFCNTPMRRLYRLNMETRQAALWHEFPPHQEPTALKVHRDGRFFATCLNPNGGGRVSILSPEGDLLDEIAISETHCYDDMVFDTEGGFYLTDLSGSVANASSGLWYVAPDSREAKPIASNMAATNGIAIAPEGNALWVTEYGCGRVHWVKITADHRVPLMAGSRVVYHSSGLEGPDSLCVDADGNVYMAMCGQGRFIVLNPLGIPIAQILLPGREQGRMLKSTHPQLRPGTDELYLCSADMKTGEAAIFVARGFAEAYHGFAYATNEELQAAADARAKALANPVP